MGLNKEVINIQNPVLGAYLIWNFTIGYEKKTPFILLFPVLPMLYRADMLEKLKSTYTNSGLKAFASKLPDDCLLNIQNFALSMRKLTLHSIQIASRTQLVSVTDDGYVHSLSSSTHKSEPKGVKELERYAVKLGKWCSEVSLYEISTILKIRF